MDVSFGESLRRLRIERGYSQQQLSDALHVDRSTVTKWETGARLPDAAMISALSQCLDADVVELLRGTKGSPGRVKAIMVDDEKIILAGGIPVLEESIPCADIFPEASGVSDTGIGTTAYEDVTTAMHS